MKLRYSLILLLTATTGAHAEDFVSITDMSQLKWQMDPSGKVWLRNLNEFNPSFLGCCYNYYIDTTTTVGKSAWSAVLTKIASSGALILGVAQKEQVGPVTYFGNW